MAEDKRARKLRAAKRNALADVKEWRIVVYSGGSVQLDRTVTDKAKAQIMWDRHREGEFWTECYADGRKLRWVEAERVLMGYTYPELGRKGL